MCIHGEDGKGDGDDAGRGGKGANIFANAASVLSMAAEEISLDDHLENELANEVELWRMETSGPAVATSVQNRSMRDFRHAPVSGAGPPASAPFQSERPYIPPVQGQLRHPTPASPTAERGRPGAACHRTAPPPGSVTDQSLAPSQRSAGAPPDPGAVYADSWDDIMRGVTFTGRPVSIDAGVEPTAEDLRHASAYVAAVSDILTPKGQVPAPDGVMEDKVGGTGGASPGDPYNGGSVDPALSPASSESTFAGFFEDPTAQDSGEVHIWLGGSRHDNPNHSSEASWDPGRARERLPPLDIGPGQRATAFTSIPAGPGWRLGNV